VNRKSVVIVSVIVNGTKGRRKLKANVKAVAHAKPGRHQIEGVKGLYLSVGDNSARWLYRYHRNGRPTEAGLGSTGDVTLAMAIDKAQELRRLVKAGVDPIAAKREARRRVASDGMTVGKLVDQYASRFADTPGTRATVALIHRHCRALTDLPLAAVDRAAIVQCLDPLQQRLPKTRARALRALSVVFGYGVENGLMAIDPADAKSFKRTWPAKPPATHHRAHDYRQCGALYARLIAKGSTVALAHAFLMLCGSRTTEVLAARRSEVDSDVWKIPAARMKNHKDHVVPLTRPALAILATMRERFPNSDFLFPADHGGRLSDRCLEGLCHRQLKLDCSVHGFRSALRDWLGNETDVPRETCEEILSHTLGGVEGAYRRSSSTPKKRAALELWATYLAGRAAP
jgi:integrase